MRGRRVRWGNVARLGAGVAAALAIVALAPSLLASPDPPSPAPDVGLAVASEPRAASAIGKARGAPGQAGDHAPKPQHPAAPKHDRRPGGSKLGKSKPDGDDSGTAGPHGSSANGAGHAAAPPAPPSPPPPPSTSPPPSPPPPAPPPMPPPPPPPPDSAGDEFGL